MNKRKDGLEEKLVRVRHFVLFATTYVRLPSTILQVAEILLREGYRGRKVRNTIYVIFAKTRDQS